MKTITAILDAQSKLKLTRLDGDEPAGLWITSLPWPRLAAQHVALGNHATYQKQLGRWPDEPTTSPRRLLLIADGGNQAPKNIPLTQTTPRPVSAAAMSASMAVLERSPHPEYVWERHLLRLEFGDKSVELALGLRTGDALHWWEACRLVITEQTAACITLEMGGVIPRDHLGFEEFQQYKGYKNPYLHKHNWLNGHLYIRFHANGVCEVYARHINSRYVDAGLDLKDVVPVIGIRTAATIPELDATCGSWDGTQSHLALGGVHFDMTEAARLATPTQPGRIDREGSLAVWQPYQGMELFGGICAYQQTGDPYIAHAEAHNVPHGMARTLRFSLSLSDRSPRIARYLAPDWWYGLCEEFLPEPLLPVANEYDQLSATCSQWVLDHIQRGGFEDGSVPRHAPELLEGNGNRFEPGWEGEIAHAQFLRAWRTGDAAEYQCALRSAYHFTDIAVDHAHKAVRPHGHLPPALSVPMARMQGTIAAYLETGDPFLLQTARAITANACWTHKNSWPRLAVGRDACFIRSAVLLYRYCGDEFYREMAHDAANDVAQVQRPNGSFGDQGGGAGLHAWGGYITKPWISLLAIGGVLDYLELVPDDEALWQCVRKFADWLMGERFDHNGVMTWSYQHDYNGGRQHYNSKTGTMFPLPTPDCWHHESLGRLLTMCALRYDEPAYWEAWVESREAAHALSDHYVAAALQFIPWVQAKLWRATWSNQELLINPVEFGPRMPLQATIATPDGKVTMSRDKKSIETMTMLPCETLSDTAVLEDALAA